MSKLLVVVDMQTDFVDGALGSPDACAIVDNVVAKVKACKAEGCDIVFTRDTHQPNYMETMEGKHLPVVHCVEGTPGWEVIPALSTLVTDVIDKPTFGSTDLVKYVANGAYDEIELVGLCTDICVVSNALLLKANFPETTFVVDSTCCAGVTKESHEAALTTMRMCHIDVI